MKPEQQIIAIAEACGWKKTAPDEWTGPSGTSYQVMFGWNTYKDGTDIIPDYLTDLNACHEMEGMIKDMGSYINHLKEITNIGGGTWCDWDFALVHASSKHRCEAFLKSHNLWTE